MNEPVSLVFNRNNPVTRSVDRVARDGATAVRKIIEPHGPVVVDHWVTGRQPAHWNLWNREDLAYSSGLTELYSSSGLRGPRLLDRKPIADGSIELWLEDVGGRTAAELSFDDHQRINRRLGEAQGKVNTDALSTVQWLSRSWLRQYALSRPPGPVIYEDAQRWEHPVVVASLGNDRHRIRQAWGSLYDESDRWLRLLERLPRTVCHLDYWPNNAIAADDGTDVLIDWAFVGDGAVGEDPGNWVPDTLFDHFMEPDQFDPLDACVWSAYSAGLDAAGWIHPIELARLAMCASAIKYIWLPGLMVHTADHSGPTGYGGQPGHPLEDVFRRRAVVFDKLLGWISEARRIAASMSIEF